jgi:hypothetical protein
MGYYPIPVLPPESQREDRDSRASFDCKMCAVQPRHLARGLKRRPRCIPGFLERPHPPRQQKHAGTTNAMADRIRPESPGRRIRRRATRLAEGGPSHEAWQREAPT